MAVVSHGYGWLGEGRDVGGQWYACRTKPGGWVACREMPEDFLSAGLYIYNSRSHRHPGALLWVWSSRNWSVFQGRH